MRGGDERGFSPLIAVGSGSMQSCTVYNCRYTYTFNDDNDTLISCANTGAGPYLDAPPLPGTL